MALTDLLTLGSRWTLVGGKGGVGKTTTAAALAVSLAGRARPVLALSVDPAHSLGDALAAPLGPEPLPVPGVPGLRAMEIDPAVERDRFLNTRRGALLTLLERGTYLDPEDASGILDLTLPGVDEVAALFRLLDLAGADDYLVVDTAPTGHALRLLELPRLARDWLGALDALDRKHRTVALALVGAVPEDEVSALLRELDGELARLQGLLTDPERTRMVLVTTREPVVLAETRRYQEELFRLGIGTAGVVVNRAEADGAEAVRGPVYVPLLPGLPAGVEGLRRFAAAAAPAPAPAAAASPASAAGVRVGGRWEPPLDREVYLVGGKGGVGKTTTACALALRLARPGRGRVLLLSTDPAGSLGDVLGQEVRGEPTPVRGAERLAARQVDAAAAWAAFRERYREDTERLFTGILPGSMDAAADRAVVERLIDLAPPGVDELVALLEVVDLAEDRFYDACVLDTAPTGHLLRLLEMPAVALQWTHALMRLLLKYREVVGLGELAERVLELSRQLRALQSLLADPGRSWMLVVALPESLGVPETERLLRRLPEVGVAAGALLVNRLLAPSGEPRGAAEAAALVRAAGTLPAVGAPHRTEAPVGPAALLSLADEWRRITLT